MVSTGTIQSGIETVVRGAVKNLIKMARDVERENGSEFALLGGRDPSIVRFHYSARCEGSTESFHSGILGFEDNDFAKAVVKHLERLGVFTKKAGRQINKTTKRKGTAIDVRIAQLKQLSSPVSRKAVLEVPLPQKAVEEAPTSTEQGSIPTVDEDQVNFLEDESDIEVPTLEKLSGREAAPFTDSEVPQKEDSVFQLTESRLLELASDPEFKASVFVRERTRELKGLRNNNHNASLTKKDISKQVPAELKSIRAIQAQNRVQQTYSLRESM